MKKYIFLLLFSLTQCSKKEEQTINQAKNSGKDKNSGWNFEVDYNDHFETPPVAYSDIVPMLKELATSLGKLPEDLIIYDPYYCQGAMVRILAELGFTKVRTYARVLSIHKQFSNLDCIPLHFTQ